MKETQNSPTERNVAESVEDVSDEAFLHASRELDEVGSHIGWTDEERESEYHAIADHLRDLRDGAREAGKELKVSLARWRLRVQVTKEEVSE